MSMMGFHQTSYLLILTGVFLVYSQDSVLRSSLRLNYLCPNDLSVTFVCITSGSNPVWRVDGEPIYLHEVGQLARIGDFNVASLLRHSENCTSVLNINAPPTNSHMTRVECYSNSSAARIEYYHRIADPPPEPTNIRYFFEEIGERTNLLNVTWSGSEDSLSPCEYEVQIDNYPVVLTRECSLVYTVSPEKNHSLRIRAINQCNQWSRNVTKELTVTRSVESSTTPSTPMSQPSGDQDHSSRDIPSTESAKSPSSSPSSSCLAVGGGLGALSAILAVLLVGVVVGWVWSLHRISGLQKRPQRDHEEASSVSSKHSDINLQVQ